MIFVKAKSTKDLVRLVEKYGELFFKNNDIEYSYFSSNDEEITFSNVEKRITYIFKFKDSFFKEFEFYIKKEEAMTKEIGSQYKAQREALGLTQQQVADQLGISRTSLSRLENGVRNITDEMKSKLDDIFSVNDSLKFEDLESGDYVYIRDDLESMKNYGGKVFIGGFGGMKSGCLIKLSATHHYCNCVSKDGFLYTPEMIDLSKSMKREDYLKMQEKENEVIGFTDVIKAVEQAFCDGVLISYTVEQGRIFASKNKNDFDIKYRQGRDSAEEYIKLIQSLYHEEFVIECEEDIKKIYVGANIHFMNGKSYTVLSTTRYNTRLMFDGDVCQSSLGIQLLKGATVKQLKGDK